MLTAATCTLVGTTAGTLAWHRCRPLRPDAPLLLMLGLPVLAGTALGAAASNAATASTTIVLLHLILAVLPLAAVDAITGKLPRRQVLATYPPTAAVVVIAALLTDQTALLRAVAGAALLWTFFLLLALLGGLGAGDVRLAPVLGAHLGYAGLHTLALGTAAAFILGSLLAVTMIASRQRPPSRAIPFGPPLLAGCVLALIS
ncbi:prepilin peptidase [Pseudonocardia sp.]|uniref:prepilin peptidase n=1 Tax=Pseudonocardia sp. TaxID=60912 RepID=UPI003D0AC600